MGESAGPGGFESAEDAIRALRGDGVTIVDRRPVGGGCIANGTRLELSDGGRVFQKSGVSRDMLRAEAEGLLALHRAGGVAAPAPLALANPSSVPFLLLEYIEPGSRTTTTSRVLGQGLATTHRATSMSGFGFHHDNFIGSTPQPNAWSDTWIGFFAERRLGYQVELAAQRGLLDASVRKGLERLVSRLGELLPEPERPALLHGDLWGGNWICGADGVPRVIDPAAYYGHREADLAMTRLFGGFNAGFYDAYEQSWPLEPGFAGRVDIYNLYHLLNHANLFGGGYAGQVASVVRSF